MLGVVFAGAFAFEMYVAVRSRRRPGITILNAL